MKQLPFVVLNLCSHVEVSLYRLHVPNAFGERAGFDVDPSHVFPQGVLEAITLLGSDAGERGTSAGTGCVVGFLSSVTVTNLPELGVLILSCWTRSPVGWA